MTTTGEPRHAVPALAEGVELLGASRGSGYRRPPCLVRRRDGQVLQLTPLLYAVLEAVDGSRDLDHVARLVSAKVDREVTAEQVHQLLHERLLPLGFLVRADGSQPELKKAAPMLGLRFRREVTDPETTRRLTTPFTVLFRPLLMLPLLAAFVAICWWVGWEKGLASATHEAFYGPGLLLLLFVLTAVSAGFHEFGHAAGATYGGARPGTMGSGLYLVWPAFYTDVTDSYRLSRGGRLRTDLGGLYFNALFAVATFGVWLAIGWDFLLLLIVTQVIQMLRQLTPIVRFDGYHVLADLTGVPDLYHHIKPILRGLLPQHWGDQENKALKPWVTVVVTAWVVVFVPLMLLALLLMVLAFPRLAGTAWDSTGDRARALGAAYRDGDLVTMGGNLLSIIAIALPLFALVYLVTRMVRRTFAQAWQATEERPLRRALLLVLAGALVTGLAWAWWPDEDRYRPIAAYESGTLADALPVVGRSTTEVGQISSAVTLWPQDQPPPTRSEPVLALVLVPQGDVPDAPPTVGATAEAPLGTWVFPFDRPPPPGAGDTQAIAVNTEDNSVVYDVSFALVWAEEGEPADNVNSAYALTSCTNCVAVAVSFQVVLVVGEVNEIVPQNIAAAVTYNCIECVAFALAQQLVVTLDGPLSDAAMAELTALWEEVAAFAENIADVSLDDIAAQLEEFEAQVIAIIEQDQGPLADVPGATPTPSGTTTPTVPSGSVSGTPSDSPSTSPTPTPPPSPTPTATPTSPTSTPEPTTTETVTPTATTTPSP